MVWHSLQNSSYPGDVCNLHVRLTTKTSHTWVFQNFTCIKLYPHYCLKYHLKPTEQKLNWPKQCCNNYSMHTGTSTLRIKVTCKLYILLIYPIIFILISRSVIISYFNRVFQIRYHTWATWDSKIKALPYPPGYCKNNWSWRTKRNSFKQLMQRLFTSRASWQIEMNCKLWVDFFLPIQQQGSVSLQSKHLGAMWKI